MSVLFNYVSLDFEITRFFTHGVFHDLIFDSEKFRKAQKMLHKIKENNYSITIIKLSL